MSGGTANVCLIQCAHFGSTKLCRRARLATVFASCSRCVHRTNLKAPQATLRTIACVLPFGLSVTLSTSTSPSPRARPTTACALPLQCVVLASTCRCRTRPLQTGSARNARPGDSRQHMATMQFANHASPGSTKELREPQVVLCATPGSTNQTGRVLAVISVHLGSSSPSRVPSCASNALQASTKTLEAPQVAKRAASIAPQAQCVCTVGEARQANVPTALPGAASQLRATQVVRIV